MSEELKCEIKRLHEDPSERQRAMREYDEKRQHLQKHFWDDWERTTVELAQRTGCSMCGFGIHLETRPHRFDLLYDRNPREWDYWMNHCCKDANGNDYGWGRVLDYIGVPWKPYKQYSIFE